MLKKTSRKLLSALLALSMMTGLLGGAVWADEPAAESVSAPTAAATPGEVSTAKPAAAPAAATPAPTALVEGEGYTWDEDTKTLTITQTDAGASDAEFTGYTRAAVHLVIDVGEANLSSRFFAPTYDTATGTSPAVEDIHVVSCGNIANSAFSVTNNKLTSIQIDQCGDIEANAFNSVSSLTQLSIGTCGTIHQITASGNIALKTLSIQQAEAIKDSAFSRCKNLETVSIEKCGNIGASAFSGLSNLSTLTIGECGDIGDRAFSGCSALSGTLTLNCGNVGKNVFNSCPNVEALVITKCGDISSNAFLGLKGIKTLTIGECGTIGASAFGSAFSMTTGAEACGALESVSIDSCTSIGSQAFCRLENLRTLHIGQCSSIGSMAFWASGAPIESLSLGNCTLTGNPFNMAKIDELILTQGTVIEPYSFNSATVKSITLDGVASVAEDAFAGIKELADLTIRNLDRIEEGTFTVYDGNVNNVTELYLDHVGYIGNYAFSGFKNLTTVHIDGSCGYVGAHAFTGCDKLTQINIPDETRLGYSDVLVKQDYIHDRVEAILADGFSLYDPETVIEAIAPAGWTSVRTGEANAAETVGDTQLTKEAKWADAEKTVADVRIQAYYTTARQMDFIFVADASNSMSGFGSADAMNSNFYNMQSKMMDVADELLSAPELDTRIAFSTFGEKPETDHALSRFFEKGEQAEAHDFIWNDIVNYESNTNYAVGLAGALELAEENVAAGRNTTVIFISDGQPYYPGEVPESYYGVAEANAIRALGVQIVSVLQQVPAGSLASSQENMAKISDQTFSSTDLAGFSTAINDAVEYALTTYTLTDTVDPAFTLDESSIEASAGTVTVGKDAAGNTTITWTLTDVPFEAHTLTFKENLNADERGLHPTGELDTNEGAAVFCSGDEVVNTVATPVLSRGTSLAVNKVWKDDAESVRPTSIDVTLLRNGEAFEKVTLNAGGSWAHTWPALDEAYAWSVEETVVPADYDAAVTNEGGAWTITNTYTREVPTTPTTPTTPSTPSTPVTATPQTGDASNALLWAALAAFGAVGLAGCTLAALRRRAR